MIPQAQPMMAEPGLKRWGIIAAQLAARNIADWFCIVSPDDLAQYAVTGADVASMLPMTLTIPTLVYKVTRYPLLVYLRGVLRPGPHKDLLYGEIRRTLADPRLFGYQFHEHVLLLSWGIYRPDDRFQLPDGRVVNRYLSQLNRFPCLVGLSSVQPWYHQNMDRIVQRIIHQLEGGDGQHDAQRADGVDSGRGGPGDNGSDPAGDLSLEAREPDLDLSPAFSYEFSGGADDLDSA